LNYPTTYPSFSFDLTGVRPLVFLKNPKSEILNPKQNPKSQIKNAKLNKCQISNPISNVKSKYSREKFEIRISKQIKQEIYRN